MAQINPYQYTLPTPSSMFVGRWELVDEIVTSLYGPQLDSWIIIGGRRFGKSSVLKAIKTRLIDRLIHHALDDWCVFPVVVDLHGAETESIQQIYAYILLKLYDALCEQTIIDINLTTTQLYSLAAREVEKLTFRGFEQILKDLIKWFEVSIGPVRFILLLDEVEHATNFPWHTTLFSQLRSLVYDSPLVGIVKLVLTGSARVIQVRETGSPLLNALKIHYLESLLPESINNLTAYGGNLIDDISQLIFEQSGGHPFIAQYLLHHLWNLNQYTMPIPIEQVVKISQQMLVDRFSDFHGWWEAIGDSGHVTYSLLVHHKIEIDENILLSKLHNHSLSLDQALRNLSYHGLIRRSINQQQCRIAGTLFRDWFVRNTPPFQQIDEITIITCLVPLRQLLIELYSTIEDAHRVAEDSGLDTTKIAQNSKLINYWNNILKEAHKHNKVREIINTVIPEYRSKSFELERIYQAYATSV